MKRLDGANEALCTVRGEPWRHGSGVELTPAMALADLADRQFCAQAEGMAAWRAAFSLGRQSAMAEGVVLLEDAEYEALVKMIERAYAPDGMRAHGHAQGVLNALTEWLRGARSVKLAAPEAAGESLEAAARASES